MYYNNSFFSYTENEAIQEMKNLAGCDVRFCVYPLVGKNLQYFISEHGDLFSMQFIKGHFLTRGPRKPDQAGHSKRHNGGSTLRLSVSVNGIHREKSIHTEKLVFCTFVLGYWDENVKVEFINGHASDIRLENIRECKRVIPPEWQAQMDLFKDSYEKSFDDVVSYIYYWSCLDIEDAKDVAQSSYIELTTTGYTEYLANVNSFVGIWCHHGRKRAIDFMRHFLEKYAHGEFTEDSFEGVDEYPYEVDLMTPVKGEKTRRNLRLWLRGYTPTQIAEMYNSTTSAVAASITHTIRFLQKHFKHEIETY